MQTPQPGQRFPVGALAPCRIELEGGSADQVAIAAVTNDGKFTAFEARGSKWTLNDVSGLGDKFEIVAYMKGDLTSGFANGAYPIILSVEGGDSYQLPLPNQPLAMVILAEIYVKDGVKRMKVSNEGFALGIDSYAQTRKYSGQQIPHRSPPGSATPMQLDPRYQANPNQGQGSRFQPGQELGAGSGVIVGPNLIITNAHVIENGSQFLLGRGKKPLNPIAVDQMHDLALLQGPTEGQGLPLRIGAPLWLGEAVMAAGYPLSDILGSDLKVTTGNISGLVGPMNDISRFQFSAPIASGSSGGAIIDEQGNLVGITSASLAHDNMRHRGAISENVNFGIRAALVYEMIAAAGMELPAVTGASTTDHRRDVINKVRQSVVGITVYA